ncbi:MAG TPA: glycerophosphodiester phosphodiesterase [Thermoanaerobaculia bacterium]|nr:glycerophosphodiester phosphodiesterase [Thermoanaerobaculia bacterium]
MSERFLIFGHRGSPRTHPENTVASFEETLRVGADGFETDLRLLSDRVAILYHDDELDDDDIETLSSKQFHERRGDIVPLADLAAFAARTTMILEVKRSKWEEALLEHVAAWADVIVASFDHSAVAELARRQAPFPLGLTVFGYVVDLAAYAARLGATWLFPNYRFVDAELVASLHERDIRVVPWTPNREREWQRLRELGCDGVITDRPGDAVRWRNDER